MKCHRNRKAHRRTGAVIVLVAVSLVVLLSIVALALDGGGLLDRRRSVQSTADAAAVAAATELFRNYPTYKGLDGNGAAKSRALAIAAANGYNNDGTNSVVQIRTSPETFSGGAKVGQPIPKGFVEVTVLHNQARYFSAVLGSDTLPVRARAVARGLWEPNKVGIHVLDLYDKASLVATGDGLVELTGEASVIVNSNHAEAGVSNGGTLIAPTFEIAGGTSTSGTSGGFFGEVNTGVPPQPDPLRALPPPDPAAMVQQRNGPTMISQGSRTLKPGVYGGITVSGQGSLTLEPGVYYMDGGGFNFGGLGNLYAEGVMIYNSPKNPSDGISIAGSGSGSVHITPMSNGLYKGMTFFQDRNAPHELNISGNGAFYVTGTFYAANALMKVSGGGDSEVGSQFISRYLAITGNGNLTIDYNPDVVAPRRVVGLVE